MKSFHYTATFENPKKQVLTVIVAVVEGEGQDPLKLINEATAPFSGFILVNIKCQIIYDKER